MLPLVEELISRVQFNVTRLFKVYRIFNSRAWSSQTGKPIINVCLNFNCYLIYWSSVDKYVRYLVAILNFTQRVKQSLILVIVAFYSALGIFTLIFLSRAPFDQRRFERSLMHSLVHFKLHPIPSASNSTFSVAQTPHDQVIS
jgi:hypothetical protein